MKDISNLLRQNHIYSRNVVSPHLLSRLWEHCKWETLSRPLVKQRLDHYWKESLSLWFICSYFGSRAPFFLCNRVKKMYHSSADSLVASTEEIHQSRYRQEKEKVPVHSTPNMKRLSRQEYKNGTLPKCESKQDITGREMIGCQDLAKSPWSSHGACCLPPNIPWGMGELGKAGKGVRERSVDAQMKSRGKLGTASLYIKSTH